MKDIPSVLITGKTPMPQRTRLIDEFERSKEPQVFLLSSRVCGLFLSDYCALI